MSNAKQDGQDWASVYVDHYAHLYTPDHEGIPLQPFATEDSLDQRRESSTATNPPPIPAKFERHHTFTRFPEGRTIYTSTVERRHGQPKPTKYVNIYDCLDPTAPEVIAARSKRTPILKMLSAQVLGGWYAETTDYDLEEVRTLYRQHRRLKRVPQIDGGFFSHVIGMVFSFWTSRELLGITLWLRKNALLTMMEFIRYLVFCIIYLFEIQWNAVRPPNVADNLLWASVERPPGLIPLLQLLGIISIFGKLFNMLLNWETFGNFTSQSLALLDFILASALIVCLSIKLDFQIYIPYFLYCLMLIPQLKIMLRSQSRLSMFNVSKYIEKFVILFVTTVVIVYMGVCIYDRFENNLSKVYQNQPVQSGKLSLLDLVYYIVITMTTVGYGDLTPKSASGRFCIIFIILVAITIIPGLVSDLLETITTQRMGQGIYLRSKKPFIIIAGDFSSIGRVKDALDTILYHDPTNTIVVVILARNVITPELKAIINSGKYRGRVVYLVGNGLAAQDMKRIDLKYAKAAFIIANPAAIQMRTEDEENTLRAWAFDDFSPETPLYVETLLPQSTELLERNCTAVVCLDEMKQTFLAFNCLYRGVGTLMLNLLQRVTYYSNYQEPWQAQYGDGTKNKFYEVAVNPLLENFVFAELSFFLFREFQVVLIGVNVVVPNHTTSKHVLLNPGSEYRIKMTDSLFFIGTSFKDVEAIGNLVNMI